MRFATFGFFNRFISLNEDISLKNATFASRRARLIPAHIWIPSPKDKCLFGLLSISNVSGSENCAGSLFAPAIIM